jgi:hypothetical protein
MESKSSKISLSYQNLKNLNKNPPESLFVERENCFSSEFRDVIHLIPLLCDQYEHCCATEGFWESNEFLLMDI